MGYYSDVAFAIDKELYAKHKLIQNDFPKIWEEHPSYLYEKTENFIVFYIESIKWSDFFDTVTEAISFMDLLDSNGYEDRYAFVRLGEEFGDKEERGDPYEYSIFTNQNISIG
jgi:hypothetical protein